MNNATLLHPPGEPVEDITLSTLSVQSTKARGCGIASDKVASEFIKSNCSLMHFHPMATVLMDTWQVQALENLS